MSRKKQKRSKKAAAPAHVPQETPSFGAVSRMPEWKHDTPFQNNMTEPVPIRMEEMRISSYQLSVETQKRLSDAAKRHPAETPSHTAVREQTSTSAYIVPDRPSQRPAQEQVYRSSFGPQPPPIIGEQTDDPSHTKFRQDIRPKEEAVPAAPKHSRKHPGQNSEPLEASSPVPQLKTELDTPQAAPSSFPTQEAPFPEKAAHQPHAPNSAVMAEGVPQPKLQHDFPMRREHSPASAEKSGRHPISAARTAEAPSFQKCQPSQASPIAAVGEVPTAGAHCPQPVSIKRDADIPFRRATPKQDAAAEDRPRQSQHRQKTMQSSKLRQDPVSDQEGAGRQETAGRSEEQPQRSSESATQSRSQQKKFRHEDPSTGPKQDGTDSGNASRKKSKLEFSDDELPPKPPSGKKVQQAQQKADRVAKKLEKAEANLPSRKKLRLETEADPNTGKARKRLRMEKEVKSQASHVKGPLPLRPVKAAANTAVAAVHQEVYKSEHENVGLQAAHQMEMVAEAGVRTGYYLHKTAPYRKVSKLQKISIRAEANAAYQKMLDDNPQLRSNAFSRMVQKRRLKRQYAKAAREAQRAGASMATAAKDTASVTKRIGNAITESVRNHPVIWLIAAGLLALMLIVFSVFSALSNIGTSVIGGIGASSYLAEDVDIDQAELMYTQWETDLKLQIQNIPTDYPGYDEYNYDIGSIGHDPFQLMAYLTAKFQDFQYADIAGELQNLFNAQYRLTLTQEIQTDPETGDDMYILKVKLTTRPFSSLVRSLLTSEELPVYELLTDTEGNRKYVQNVFGFNWLPYVSSRYGYRIHPITGNKAFHSGVDIGMAQGTSILAGHDGIVTQAGDAGGYGLCIVLNGSVGESIDLATRYAHCSQLLVSVGQEVRAGDVIAKVGSTGNSTGPHLHLEVMINGQTMNPLYFADTGANETES